MKTTTDGNVDVKRPDEVELLREALNDLSDLPNGLASGLLDLLNKKDDKHRAASIRELIEEFARRISSTPFSFGFATGRQSSRSCSISKAEKA